MVAQHDSHDDSVTVATYFQLFRCESSQSQATATGLSCESQTMEINSESGGNVREQLPAWLTNDKNQSQQVLLGAQRSPLPHTVKHL